MRSGIILIFFTIFCILKIVLADGIINKYESPVSTLKLAIGVFRHGDRTPIYTYPGDPHSDYPWPGGLSTLTTKGSLQMYNLGKTLGDRYSEHLPSNGLYSNMDLIAISSETERTIMSAQGLLAGFMVPSTHVNLLPVKWQPIPVHVITYEKDSLLLGSRRCEKYQKLLANVMKNPPEDYLDMINEIMPIQKFSKYMRKHTGMPNVTCMNLIKLYDTLEIQENYNLTLPEWTKPVSPKKMKKVIDRCYAMFTETLEMKRIRAGSLLTEISEIIEKKIKKELLPDRKFFFYSGHDVTLSALIRAFDIENQTTTRPEYGSSLVFELHENPSIPDDFEVKLYFFECGECTESIQVELDFCPQPCPFKIFNDFLIDNYFRKFEFYCSETILKSVTSLRTF